MLGREATATAFARASREPSALDLRRDAAPLLLRRDGGELVLDWEGVDGQAALLHAGSLESLVQDRAYDHARLSPCPGESSSARIGLGAGDRYFLLSAECGWGGGSPGRDSFGRPRSRGRGACE